MATPKNNAILTLNDGNKVAIRIRPSLVNVLSQLNEEGMSVAEIVNYALSFYAECHLGFESRYINAPMPQLPEDWRTRGLGEDGSMLPPKPEQVATMRATWN